MPVELPSLRDPRLHVAGVLLTVQVLGQVVIDWDLSIAQLLICLGTAFGLEVAIVAYRRGVLSWPASALLTGNGVALLLRVPGTQHGDWWSLWGAYAFAGTVALAVLSKHAVRVAGRPLFNPSNIGLVVCFLVLGPARVEPQDLWWGPWSAGLALTYAVIVVGGVVITRRLGLFWTAAGFLVSLGLGVAVVAARGHGFVASWHVGPVEGRELWHTIVLSPETLIFAGFMVTDPRTVPKGRSARLAFGVTVGLLASVLLAPQSTEFATKVAILSSLVIACAARPWFERVVPTIGRRRGVAIATVGLLLTLAALLAVVGTTEPFPGPVGPTGERPQVAVGELPPVEIGSSVDGATLPFAADDLDTVATDLLEDLAIEAEALRTHDVHLAAHGASGPRLDELRRQIAEHGAVVVPQRTFTRLTLVLYRDPDDAQAAPRLGFEAEGTIRLDRIDGDTVSRGPTRPFAVVYLVAEIGDNWLIDGERPA